MSVQEPKELAHLGQLAARVIVPDNVAVLVATPSQTHLRSRLVMATAGHCTIVSASATSLSSPNGICAPRSPAGWCAGTPEAGRALPPAASPWQETAVRSRWL